MLSQNKMYQTIYSDERVPLTPTELNRISVPDDDPKEIQTSIKNILEEKLRLKYEGFCNANGYVRKGSIKLIAKSMGVAESGRFTGNFLYDCKISADVYYPIANSLVDVRILKKNAMGAYAVLSAGADDIDEAMQVNIPRDLHPRSAEFEAIEPNQIVKIRILRSRFQINDRFIMAVGRLHDYEVANGIEVEDSDISDTDSEVSESDTEETEAAPSIKPAGLKKVEETESDGEDEEEDDEE